MTRLLLIRHGHSEANRDNVFGGNVDVALTPTGQAQAEKMSRFVLSHYTVEAVYASTLQRAFRTAACIADPLGLPMQQDSRLREFYGGVWDGMSFDAIREQYPEEYMNWRTALHRAQPPGGENAAQVQKRGIEAINAIAAANEGKTVAVVSHRGILRTLQCVWERRPLEEIHRCKWLSNCSVSELAVENGVWTPVCIGQDGFMGEDVTPVTSAM